MPQINQLHGSNTATEDAYTGPARELTVDTTLKQLRLQDGATAGGTLIPNETTVDAKDAVIQGNITTHIGDTTNPHSVTAAQAGADPAGTSATHAAVLSGVHGITTYTATLIASATAAAARSVLGLIIGTDVLAPTGDGSGLTGIPLQGKNLFRNPRGQNNQREYVSGTATTGANEYTLDLMRVVTSGESLTWTESEGTKTFTAPAGGVELPIIGADIITGTHVIAWTGTATCTVDTVAKTSGATFTLTGGTISWVKFIGGTFTLHQVEEGTVATDFSNVPSPITDYLCKEHLYVLNASDAAEIIGQGGFTSTAIAFIHVPLPLQFSGIPSLTISNVAHFLLFAPGGGSSTVTAFALNSETSKNMARLQINGTGTPYTLGQVGELSAQNASGQVIFSVEP